MLDSNQDFNKSVFINCPFDPNYQQMLRALIFTVLDLGFKPRIASERNDAGEVRVSKIKKLIMQSRYSIHDISRMEPLKRKGLPRFNMPFELGLDLGCKEFGEDNLCQKRCLILEKEKYRYKEVISDIPGNDIAAHNNDPETLVRRVRDWILKILGSKIKSGTAVWQRFNVFYAHFEETCKKLEYETKDIEDMSIVEYIIFVNEWIGLDR